MAQQAAFTVAFNLEPQFDGTKLDGALSQIQQKVKASPDLDLDLQIKGLDTSQAQEVVNSLKKQYEQVSNVVLKTQEYKNAMGETKTAITGLTADLSEMVVTSQGIVEVTSKYSTNLDDAGMRIAKMSGKYDNLRLNAEEWYQRSQSMSEKERTSIQANVKTLTDLISKYETMGNKSPAEVKKLEEKINAADEALKKTVASTKRSATGLQNWAQTMERAIKQTVAYSFSLGLVRAAQRALNDAIQYTIDLNTEMTKIQVLQAQGAQTPEEIRELASSYNDLAKELGATTLEIAEGSVEWLRQGKSVEETADLMRASTMMAKLGNVELAQATEFLTSTLNGFEMEAEQAIEVVDKLVHVDNIAATSVEELATALRYVSAVANQSGVSFEELVSYITVLSETTRLNAEQIGQSLKTIFTRMQDIMQGGLDPDGLGINNVERALERVDVQLRDSETSFRDLGAVLEDVAVKWDTLNEVEQANIAKAIAGVRQQNMFRILMQEMNVALEYQAEAFGAVGTATERYEIYLESIEAKQATLKASIEGLYQDSLDDGLIVSFYDAGIAIVDIIDNIGGLQQVLISLIGVFAILRKEQIAGLITDFGLLAGKILRLIAIQGVATTATQAFTAALNALNLTNPVGWVMLLGTAIATGIPLIKAIVNDIDDLKDKAKEAGNALEETSEKLNSLSSTKSTIGGLWKEFEELSEKTELSSDELDRYYEIQAKIAQLLPEVISYYDENGRLVLAESTNLEELNSILDEYIGKAYEQLRVDAELAVSAEQDVLNAHKRKKAWAEAAQVIMETTENEAFLFKSSEKWQTQLEEASEGILESGNIIKRNFNKLGIEGKQALISGLKAEEGYEDLVDDLTEMLTRAVDDAIKRVQEDPDVSLVNLFDDYGAPDEVEEFGETAAEKYVEGLLRKMGMSESEIEAQMKDIFTSAVPSSQFFTEIIPEIEAGANELAEAFDKVSNKEIIGEDEVKKLKEFDIIIQPAIDGTLEFYHVAEDGSTVALNSLEEYIDAQLESKSAIDKINPIMKEAGRNMLLAALKSDTLADSISNSADKINILSSALEEQSQNGYMSVQTAMKLVSANSSLRSSLVKVANGFYINEDAARKAAWAELQFAMQTAEIPGLASAAASGNWLLAQSLIDLSGATIDVKSELSGLLGIYAQFASADFSVGGGGGGGGGGPSPEEQALQDQIDALQDVIDKENRLWEERTRIWDRAIEDFERQIDSINEKYDDLIEPLQDQVDALQEVIDESAEALDDLKWGFQDRLWELEDAIQVWEDQIDDWEKLLEEETKQWHEEIDAWEEYIDDYEDQIDALNEARESELEPLEEQLKELEEYRDTELEILKDQKDIYKDQVSDLKDLLKEYNEYIDAQKKSLQLMKEEEDYLDSLKDKNEELGKIKSEIAILSLDDSEKAIAERLKLEEEAANIEEEIAEDQADREYELKIQALEDAREAFEDNINAQISAIEDLMDAIDDEIDLINEQIEALEDQIEVINRRYEFQIDAIEDEIKHYEKLIKANEDLIEDKENYYETLMEGNEELIKGYEEEIDAINRIIDEAEREHEILTRNHEEQIEDIEDRIEALETERDTYVGAIEEKIAAIEEERFHAQRAHEDRMWELDEEMRRLDDLMKQYEDVGGGGGAAWQTISDELKEYMKELEKARLLLESFKIDTSQLSEQAILDIYAMTEKWYESGSSIDEAAVASQTMARVMADALDDVDDSLTDTQDEIDDVRDFIELLGVDTSDMKKQAIIDIGEMIQQWVNQGLTIDEIADKLANLPSSKTTKVDVGGNALSKIDEIKRKLGDIKDKTVTIKTNEVTSRSETTVHSGGLIETHHTGNSFAGNLRSNEVFAKLLKGEYVSTEGQMDNFLKNILPRVMSSSSPSIDRSKNEKEVNITLSMPITVEGNMDENILPSIDDIADKAIGKINDVLVQRGIKRNVSKFGF